MARPAPPERGSYVLCLARSGEPADVRIGALGILALLPGLYCYAGSAFGPGGLAGRLRHHWAISPRPHWHIDYLRAHCRPRGAWYALGENHEHQFATVLGEQVEASLPLAGFGASDCSCRTHLYRLPPGTPLAVIQAALAAAVPEDVYWAARS